MPLTPLHVAYVWPLKWRFKHLSFSALTLGSIIPDLEIPVMYFAGLSPSRLVTHSLLGAFTIDLLITLIFMKVLSAIKIDRFGVNGFNKYKVDVCVIYSALIGSLTHVSIDLMHHEHNPIFWPFGPKYIGSPLFNLVGSPRADTISALVSLLILVYVVKRALNSQGYGLSLIFSQPVKALSLVTSALS